VKVRIRHTPPEHEHEIDGVKLGNLPRGAVRDVSPSLGTWLIVEGYADPEMRTEEDRPFSTVRKDRTVAADRRRHRRRSD